jgi:nucleotide-binding universal stress UspA family protein
MRVLSAVQPRAWMRDLDRGDPPPGAVAAELRARAEDAAAEATPDDPGVPADVDVDTRDAAELLVSASQEADLLVCGARSYGPAPATLLGGVARRVVTEARCPVIVLARGAEVELEQLLAGDGR